MLLMNDLNIQHCWGGVFVLESLQTWYSRKDLYSQLPLFVMWEVWKARNVSIFSIFLQKTEFIYLKILSSFSEWCNEPLPKKCRNYSFPPFLQEHPVGFFDGAAKDGVCGAGILIKFDKNITLKGWLKAGIGTNTWA